MDTQSNDLQSQAQVTPTPSPKPTTKKPPPRRKYDWDKLKETYLSLNPRPTLPEFAKSHNVNFHSLSIKSVQDCWIKDRAVRNEGALAGTLTKALSKNVVKLEEINRKALEVLNKHLASKDPDSEKWATQTALEYTQIKPASRIETSSIDVKKDVELENDIKTFLEFPKAKGNVA